MRASRNSVYLVCAKYDQSAFTEPRYWASAREATNIVGAFRNESKANTFAERVRKNFSERTSEDEEAPTITVTQMPLLRSGRKLSIEEI